LHGLIVVDFKNKGIVCYKKFVKTIAGCYMAIADYSLLIMIMQVVMGTCSQRFLSRIGSEILNKLLSPGVDWQLSEPPRRRVKYME